MQHKCSQGTLLWQYKIHVDIRRYLQGFSGEGPSNDSGASKWGFSAILVTVSSEPLEIMPISLFTNHRIDDLNGHLSGLQQNAQMTCCFLCTAELLVKTVDGSAFRKQKSNQVEVFRATLVDTMYTIQKITA